MNLRITLLFFLIVTITKTFAQPPKEVDEKTLTKLKAELKFEADNLRKSLLADGISVEEADFISDTFRIHRLAAKRMEIDYSTVGMLEAINTVTEQYDLLLNKYYNLLISKLSAEDKKYLINAQKAWLKYRDAEAELIRILRNEEYSGGGTMQLLISADLYCKIVQERTLKIFDYYNSIISLNQ